MVKTDPALSYQQIASCLRSSESGGLRLEGRREGRRAALDRKEILDKWAFGVGAVGYGIAPATSR